MHELCLILGMIVDFIFGEWIYDDFMYYMSSYLFKWETFIAWLCLIVDMRVDFIFSQWIYGDVVWACIHLKTKAFLHELCLILAVEVYGVDLWFIV